jgi:hypothetical protein
MMESDAILLVIMEPPAGLEEEFNDWYDTEHFPQRCALPGFQSGARWVCVEGWPKWAALYDLATPEALTTPEYKAVSVENSTPWSRRILPRTNGRERFSLQCVLQQRHESLNLTHMSAMTLAWIEDALPDDVLEELTGSLTGLRVAYHLRLCRISENQKRTLAIFESVSDVTAQATAVAMRQLSRGVTSRVNRYVRYRR